MPDLWLPIRFQSPFYKMWFTVSSPREATMANGVIYVSHIAAGHVWKTCTTTRIAVSILPSPPLSYCGLKVDRRTSAELERRKMNMLLFLDPLAGGQKWSTSIYRAEENGEDVRVGFAGTARQGDALSDGLWPRPWSTAFPMFQSPRWSASLLVSVTASGTDGLWEADWADGVWIIEQMGSFCKENVVASYHISPC